jgi:anaerobic selenocysteine-containing dehydrogenase
MTGKHALLLPCLARTDRDTQKAGDQFVTVENSMGIVHASQGRLEPPSKDLLSEPMIVAWLASATLKWRTKIAWLDLVEDYNRIRDLIARVVPGCEDLNRRVRAKGGFYLPNAAREGRFETSKGKANFTVSAINRIRLGPGQFLLTTLRSHDQFNTTIYGLDDRYRGVYNGRRVVFMNPADIAEHGWKAGDRLDITSHFSGANAEERRTALRFFVTPYDIPRRCVAAYFPEANALVPIGSVAKISNTPVSKAIVVTFELSKASDSPVERLRA